MSVKSRFSPQEIEQTLGSVAPRALRWLTRELRDKSAAQDVWDATRTQVHEDAALCKGDLRPWIWAVLRNRKLDKQRALGTHARLEPHAREGIHPERQSATGPGTRQIRARIRTLVDELPEHERTIVWMRNEENMTSDEIAHVVRVSKTGQPMTADNVRRELTRILAKLEEKLRKQNLHDVALEHLRSREAR